jgi:uncharacterized protein (UPF0332 family)
MLDLQQIIKYRIQKSWDTYGDAKLLVETKSYSSALNRIYYACFYMVNALLLTKNLSSSKHTGVKSFFNKHFVSLGCVDKKWGSFYSDLFQKRQDADYADLVTISQDTVILYLNLAMAFLTDLDSFINQKSG